MGEEKKQNKTTGQANPVALLLSGNLQNLTINDELNNEFLWKNSNKNYGEYISKKSDETPDVWLILIVSSLVIN